MQKEYSELLSSPGSMISDSLSGLIDDGGEPAPPQINTYGKLAISCEGEKILSTHRVNEFSATTAGHCSTTFHLSRDQIYKSQDLWGKVCDVQFGKISLESVSCASWSFGTVDNTVSLTFQRLEK